MQDRKKPKVVVVGGGFAGIEAIKTLRSLCADVEVTLVSKAPIFEYYPALYKLVTGALPIEVSVPLRKIFPHKAVAFHEATFTGVDQARQVVLATTHDGAQVEYPYDFLVIALGSETNFFNIKGLPELSHSFKSVHAALRLKQHFCELFAKAKTLTKEELVAMLHVIIVGAGPSGVELAGDLRSYLTGLAETYGVDPSFVTIDLIESNNRVLRALPEKVSVLAEARLRKMGVNIFLNRTLASQEVEEVILRDMQLNSHTVIWTAGTRINSAFLNVPGAVLDEQKRVTVNEYLSLPTDNRIFIAGDGAGVPYSGLAQTAIEHGKFIGKHIFRITHRLPLVAHKPKAPSYVIPIGNYWALFIRGTHVFRGFLPWLLRSAVDFKYFTSIVPLHYVFAVFKNGRKYRRVHGGCPFPERITHEAN